MENTIGYAKHRVRRWGGRYAGIILLMLEGWGKPCHAQPCVRSCAPGTPLDPRGCCTVPAHASSVRNPIAPRDRHENRRPNRRRTRRSTEWVPEGITGPRGTQVLRWRRGDPEIQISADVNGDSRPDRITLSSAPEGGPALAIFDNANRYYLREDFSEHGSSSEEPDETREFQAIAADVTSDQVPDILLLAIVPGGAVLHVWHCAPGHDHPAGSSAHGPYQHFSLDMGQRYHIDRNGRITADVGSARIVSGNARWQRDAFVVVDPNTGQSARIGGR